MTRPRLLSAVASAALFAIATCSVASAAPDAGGGLNLGSHTGSVGGLDISPNDLSQSNNAVQHQDAPNANNQSGLTIEDFINADKNHDGYLSKKEFKSLAAMVKKQNVSSNALDKVRKFGAEDKNNDGKISARELGVLGAGAG